MGLFYDLHIQIIADCSSSKPSSSGRKTVLQWSPQWPPRCLCPPWLLCPLQHLRGHFWGQAELGCSLRQQSLEVLSWTGTWDGISGSLACKARDIVVLGRDLVQGLKPDIRNELCSLRFLWCWAMFGGRMASKSQRQAYVFPGSRLVKKR